MLTPTVVAFGVDPVKAVEGLVVGGGVAHCSKGTENNRVTFRLAISKRLIHDPFSIQLGLFGRLLSDI